MISAVEVSVSFVWLWGFVLFFFSILPQRQGLKLFDSKQNSRASGVRVKEKDDWYPLKYDSVVCFLLLLLVIYIFPRHSHQSICDAVHCSVWNLLSEWPKSPSLCGCSEPRQTF